MADAIAPDADWPAEIRFSGESDMELSCLNPAAPGVAHDLGNQLQIVASAVRLIERGLERTGQEALSPLTRSALESLDRAGALVLTMLGRAPKAADAPLALESCLEAIQERILLVAGPSVVVEFVLGHDVPAIRCDPGELEDAIFNLVANAVRAMPLGGRLTLTACRGGGRPSEAEREPKAVLRVSDTGCGMSADVLARAFKPYFTTESGDRGTGLGLAMVRGFARRAGGSAEIESELGIGTSVTLRLPGVAETAHRPVGRVVTTGRDASADPVSARIAG